MADELAGQQPTLGGESVRSGDRAPLLRIHPLRGFLTYLGEITQLFLQALRFILRGGIDARDWMRQMVAIGVGSAWIVVIITVSTGAVFAYYTVNISKSLGVVDFIGGTLGYTFFNELGPTLCGAALASRSGAAIAAEIGSMVVTEQVDALRAMAVSPVRYLIVPRLLAAICMLPVMTVFADVSGVLGGYSLALLNGVPHQIFWNSFQRFVHTDDLTRGLIKSVVFGIIISLVACHQGLKTEGGATGVGRSTTSSVVRCVVLIFISNFFLTQMLTPKGRLGP